MKAIIYREVDVSNICKYCGYPLDVSTHLCLHCRIEENLKKNDFVSRKALWSDECFTKNFHHENFCTHTYRELPYAKFQKIDCVQFCQYNNLFGVCFFYDQRSTQSYYGYVDDNNHIIIPLVYEKLGKPNETGILSAKLNGRYGVISIDNQIIVPFEYDYLDSFYDGLARFEKEGQKGYINIHGQQVINLPSSCQETHNFQKGQAKVGMRINGKCLYGFIDKAGKFIISPAYDFAELYADKYYRVRKNLAHVFLIDRQGFQILNYGTKQQIALPLDKYYIYGIICGQLIKVARYKKSMSYNEDDQLLWGVIDISIHEVVPLEYSSSQIKLIEGDYILIKEDTGWHYWTSIIGINGSRIPLPESCSSVEYMHKCQIFKLRTKMTCVYGLLSFEHGSLKVIAPLIFEKIIPCLKRHSMFKYNGLWGILSHETGMIIIQPQFHKALKSGDSIYVRSDKQCGFFTPNANTDILSFTPCSIEEWEDIVRCKHSPKHNVTHGLNGMSFLQHLGWEYIYTNNLTGVVSIDTMKIIIPPIYNAIRIINPDKNNRPLIVVVKKYENSYGLMKTNGVLLTPCIHNDINEDDIMRIINGCHKSNKIDMSLNENTTV